MLESLLIMLREGFEAALVVAILFAYLQRSGRRHLLPALWAGVGAAVVVSVGAGIVIHSVAGSLEGKARSVTFAVICFTAVVVLTWMIFWMRQHARSISGELKSTMETAIEASHGDRVGLAVAVAAFVAVAREGLEASLFLVAVATDSSGTRVFVGGLIGLAVAGGAGWLVVVGGKRLPLKQFFSVTGVVLVIFAAGLAARGILFLQQGSILASADYAVYDLTSVHFLTQGSEIGKFLSAMLGWDPRPSVEQLLAWVAYVAVVLPLFLRRPAPRPAVAAPVEASPVSAGR